MGEKGAVTSIIEAFDLFYPATLIKLIKNNTNHMAVILFSSNNPPKFLLDWINLTLLECYEFIVMLLFM